MTTLRGSRWALSFADLCLLLLGFFVMLNVTRRPTDIAVAELSKYFGGKPSASAAFSISAAFLFQPGEAMLTRKGALRLQQIAREAFENGQLIQVSSMGEDPAGRRFDRWELAAARLAAVARMLRQSGLPEDRIQLRGLDEAQSRNPGQHLLIRRTKYGK